jgi:hypothetical protein
MSSAYVSKASFNVQPVSSISDMKLFDVYESIINENALEHQVFKREPYRLEN